MDKIQPVLLPCLIVIFTISRRNMHNAGTVFHRDKISGNSMVDQFLHRFLHFQFIAGGKALPFHAKFMRVEQRLIFHTDQFFTHDFPNHRIITKSHLFP